MIDLKRFRSDKNISQKELCAVLGVAQSYLSAIENGDRPLNAKRFELLYQHYGDVVLDYRIADVIISLEPRNQDVPMADVRKRKLIPLFDDVATVGGTCENVATVEDGQVAYSAEWVDTGDWFPEATMAIRHYGDSMVEYPSGSILALKRVFDRELIISGRNYVIETDEFRITKQLHDDGSEFLFAYSTNRDTYPDGRQIHAPFRIRKEKITSVYLVLGCVTKEYSSSVIVIQNPNVK